jgi:pimeloyl-ACP methyl ester carboxylesterase
MGFITSAGVTTVETASVLTMPILCIAGAEDIVFPVDYLRRAAAALPGARFEIIDAAGHSAYFERAEAVNSAIERFLSNPHI